MQRISYSLSASEERRPDYLVLAKTYLEDHLVRRPKGLDGGALAVLTDAADGGERLHPGYRNLHCTACRHLDKLTIGSPLG